MKKFREFIITIDILIFSIILIFIAWCECYDKYISPPEPDDPTAITRDYHIDFVQKADDECGNNQLRVHIYGETR